NGALGLWMVDLITRRFGSGDKRLFVLLLLMLLPVYQLHAQRFNANAVLLPTWPLATYCFLRSFETRQAGWAVAAGLTGAMAMLLAVPAAICAFVAGDRLKTIRHDFKMMDSGLLLLFYIAIGTIVLPAVTAAAFGTDMPALWGLQGLFLFVILMVCGLRDPIPRLYSVNLAASVIGIALLAAFVAAPIHAVYRNDHPLHEGRNFYQQAADELTRLWHDQSDTPLLAVGGDDGLAFALAFY